MALPSTVTFTNNAGGDDITVLNTSITLDGTEQDAGTVMVEPGATMTVDVTVGDSSTPTFVDIPVNITGNANTVAGQAYAITLSFSGKAVESLEATITGWGTETTGSGDIY